MRIGEILIERGYVEPARLQRALAEQRHTNKRLCSMLISRGLLDPDDASRALGDQHRVPAVLQRHLEGRDHAVATLIPAELARSYIALPIGRTRGGELIICVRDPKPEIIAALAAAVGATPIGVAITPAFQLEQLVLQVYGPAPANEFDVDLTTGPIAVIDEHTTGRSVDAGGNRGSIDVDLATGPIDIGTMSLVDLDDSRVAKDHSHLSGLNVLPNQRAQPALPRTKTPPAGSLRVQLPVVPPTLVETVAALEVAAGRDDATDAAMRFVAGRWTAALLLTVKEGALLGHRGTGPQLSGDAVAAVALPLTAISIVKLAHDTRRIVTDVPAGAGTIQTRLERMLGQPKSPIAAPILLANRVAGVLAVGDPAGDPDDDSASDLDRLCDALGEAYARITRNAKRP